MEITKSNLEQFRADFQSAMKNLETKYGIVVKAKNIVYNQSGFHFPVEVQNVQEGEEGMNVQELKMKREFPQYCGAFGFNPEDYGKTIFFRGEAYTLLGFNPSSYKYPILAKSQKDGRTYKLSAGLKIA